MKLQKRFMLHKKNSNESSRVSAEEEVPSPRVPKSKTTSPEKATSLEKAKVSQSRTEVNKSSPQRSTKTKVNIVNSSPIATRTRSQVAFNLT